MKKVLKSLGYRELTNGLYGKPFAYNLFSFNLEKLEFVNNIMSTDGTILIWNLEKYEEEFEENNFMEFIKYCESFSHIESCIKSNFQFLLNIEQLTL